LQLSGDRFSATYRLTGFYHEVCERAEDICLEQTVELPADLVPDGPIRAEIVGRVEEIREIDEEVFEARISYTAETAAFDLPQLLNVLFGNISLKPGIRLLDLQLPDSLLEAFRGPRFGVEGWREILNVKDRPLLCSALKPMGFSAVETADLAYRLALGGIDIIKDDHGLTDQPFCRFEERAGQAAAAVQRANAETGGQSVYVPHVTTDPGNMRRRAAFAREIGAGALLICPGLAGFPAMRALADDDEIALPLIAHPALLGSYVTSRKSGIAHGLLFGKLMRLAGADATIFPNWGGRFAFSRYECLEIARGSAAPLGSLKPILPTPAGGMDFGRIGDMARAYGRECMYLIGGALFRAGDDLVAACRTFRRLVEQGGEEENA